MSKKGQQETKVVIKKDNGPKRPPGGITGNVDTGKKGNLPPEER